MTKTMTKEERLAKMVELKAAAEEKVKAYNAAMLDEKFADAAKVDEELAEVIADYSGHAQTIAFDMCKAASDPMLAAVTALSFSVIATKDTKEGESKIPIRQLVEKEKQIDLAKLHKYCGNIGKDKNWLYKAEKFNCLLTAQAAIDLGVKNLKEINDSYAMAEISKNIDLGKNPTSKTQILKTLRGIITAMIGEEFANKVTSHDVNFLLMVYAKKSRKALTVTTANHKTLRGFLAEICHRVVLDKLYEVEYKKSNK